MYLLYVMRNNKHSLSDVVVVAQRLRREIKLITNFYLCC